MDKGSKSAKGVVYKAGKGIAPRILIAVVVVAVLMIGIMILSKLNMGEAPAIFGYSLEGLV